MIEIHPFGIFAPSNTRFMILGSFTGKEAAKETTYYDPLYDWFYGTKRNQFWPILEAVYGIELKDKASKQRLFTLLGIAIADIIYQCERRGESNLDQNLINKVYNIQAIAQVVENYPVETIFFTSRGVEKSFKLYFRSLVCLHPKIELITLPSPSPRYARMSREEKIARYKELLPSLAPTKAGVRRGK